MLTGFIGIALGMGEGLFDGLSGRGGGDLSLAATTDVDCFIMVSGIFWFGCVANDERGGFCGGIVFGQDLSYSSV